MSALDALRAHLAPAADLGHAAALLEWDQETYMPPGAAQARSHQLATLRRLQHEIATDEALKGLLETAEGEAQSELDRALVRVARRDYARSTRLSAGWVTRQALATSAAKEAWKAAREADDFGAFAPHLQAVVDLAVEKAEALAPVVGVDLAAPDARYTVLLDEFEPGATTADVERVFRALKRELVPLVEAVAAAPQLDDAPAHGAFDPDVQWAFGLEVAAAFGYSLMHGRQDRSAHPFTTSFGSTDVRITTRLDPAFFPTAFYGTLHEAGHALYEQGFDPALARTPLADGTSLGMHESQSRLWENQVGRSRAFWSRWYEPLQRAFPQALKGVSEDAFYRAVNRVAPSPIRVEADELTYHLHVILRFEIERALVAGSLKVADVPAAWNDGMLAALGITPTTDAEGCLQDIHWSLGALGYFPTYTLGTLMSAQLWDAAARDLGDLDALVASGDTAPLLDWLRTHVHRWGRARSAGQILQEATGSGLDAGPWLAYARAKFGALYGLDEGSGCSVPGSGF